MVIQPTPLQECGRIGAGLGVHLLMKRDDLLPIAGGGSKLRKVLRILRMADRPFDALVTTGGTQSNHARVVAILAAQNGWRCRLVLHGDPNEAASPSGNLLLMLLAGAEVEIVEPDRIAEEMASAVSSLARAGARPLEIPGGGHSLAGALSYADAVAEAAEQLQGAVPDFIVHASGTGATQAGILAGCAAKGWMTRVIGVSVARRNPRGRSIVCTMKDEAADAIGVTVGDERVEFLDEWVGDGYEHASKDVLATIRSVATTEGIMLDPTYTGKAFLALRDLVQRGVIPSSSRVLFWHTGGLLNLISSRYATTGLLP